MLGVLATLAVPALSRVEGASRVAQCAGNLRQLALATEIYAYENGYALPVVNAGNWDWDVPVAVTDPLMRVPGRRETIFIARPILSKMRMDWGFGPVFV